MSIRVKQEICLNVAKIRCIASQAIGRFALRFHIYERAKNYHKIAVPVSVIQSPPSSKPQYEINEISYTTKPFIMKISGEVPIAELCIFKNDINIFNYQPDFHEVVLTLVCELIQIDSQKERVVGTFEGRIRGDSINDCMVIDFYQYGACQVVGSIHSCVYQFEYSSNNPKIPNFQTYCDTQTKQYVESLLEYLLEESKKSQENIINYLEALKALDNESMSSSIVSVSRYQNDRSPEKKFLQPPKFDDGYVGQQQQFENLYSQVQVVNLEQKTTNISKIEEFGNRATEADEGNQRNSYKFSTLKKKRKRIFIQKRENQKTSKVTIQEFERMIHQNAMVIYEKWRKILNLLMESQGQIMLEAYLCEYKQKYEKLLNESVIKFKGSYDVDIYGNEELQRNKMAYQIRTQSKQNQRYANQFKFYNAQFFKGSNPVFFYEELTDINGNNGEISLKKSIEWKSAFDKNVISLGKNEKKRRQIVQEKFMVILVHGLGACRVDMEKIKMQLKRIHNKGIHIMISSCNQSRTEGDIDSMGMRLANQIQHEIAKVDFKPKICLIGHSMGGVIIRSALPRLEKHSELFHSFVTLSSPHVGYSYSSSKLVDVGLWMINYWKKCQSILQLTMADSQNIEECFLYQLSKKKGMQWFKKVTFIGSHQDMYVPYYSARIQKHHQCIIDQRNKVSKALVHTSMIDNILNRVKGQINRIDVNFTIPQQYILLYLRNIDNLIGRAAHINFVNNLETLRLFCFLGQDIIF